jgi:hypothetical protein
MDAHIQRMSEKDSFIQMPPFQRGAAPFMGVVRFCKRTRANAKSADIGLSVVECRFTPTMNAKPNPIGILRTMNSGLRVQGLGGRVALASAVLARPAPPPAKACLSRFSCSADDRAEDFWETLSYAVIWLCGWIGVVLCFFRMRS